MRPAGNARAQAADQSLCRQVDLAGCRISLTLPPSPGEWQQAGQHPPLCCVLPQAVLSLTGYRMPDPLLTFSSAAAYPNASLSLPGGFGRAVGTPPCFEARRMVFQRDLRDVKV